MPPCALCCEKIEQAYVRRHADALALVRRPVLRRTPKNANAGHQTLREESVMKCSNPYCSRCIGLVAHRRAWFDKRRYCSKECRNTFVAERPKMSQQNGASRPTSSGSSCSQLRTHGRSLDAVL